MSPSEPTLMPLHEQRDPRPKPPIERCRFCRRELVGDEGGIHRVCDRCDAGAEYAA